MNFSCNFCGSGLERPEQKFYQIGKIRPFFQSARRADSKNAKIFEKTSFFEKNCLRKPARVHRPSDFFCSKSCIWLSEDKIQVWEKLFDSFWNDFLISGWPLKAYIKNTINSNQVWHRPARSLGQYLSNDVQLVI